MPSRLVLSLMLFASSAASAATFCVSTPTEFQTALTTAQSNGQNDVILVEPGAYVVNAPLDYYASENFDLSVSGGWEGCVHHHNDPRYSVIDGHSAYALAHFVGAPNSTGNISVSWLTFRNGAGAGSSNPVVFGLVAGWQGALTVENNVFTNLEGRVGSGVTAVELDSDQGTILVRNNLFANNRTDSLASPVHLLANNPVFSYVGEFTNNTATGNMTGDSNGTETGGIHITGAGIWSVTNNITWGNSGHDLHLGPNIYYLHNNDIGSSTGGTPFSTGNNLAVDPGFVDTNGNYRLRGDSPLVNAGLNSAPGGIGTYDIGGAPGTNRLVFGTVDIGAYELQDRIFADSFDSL